MITQGDDYPIHQTPEPVQQVFTSDRNFYDRFFFNGYFREGEPYFAAAMGIYPNIGMIDCAFSVIVGGVQHCVRASRVLGVPVERVACFLDQWDLAMFKSLASTNNEQPAPCGDLHIRNLEGSDF